MKLVRCPECGAPLLLDWTLDQYTLSDRLHCHACGYSDFVYVFLERGDRPRATQASLGDSFATEIHDIAAGLRSDAAVGSLLSSLSRRYRLSTFALVDIINSFLDSKDVEPAPYNPLSYVTLDESVVDAGYLLRRIDEVAAETVAHTTAAAPAADASDADRWRMQYEQSMIQLDSLNDKYGHLRTAFDSLKAENRRLKEYLGE